MKIAARLSLIKQYHIELCGICDPLLVSEVQPKESQKDRYIELLKQFKNHIDVIETDFKKGILNEAAIQIDVPRDLLEYYKDKVQPNQAAIDRAFETLAPDLANLFRLVFGVMVPRGAEGLNALLM